MVECWVLFSSNFGFSGVLPRFLLPQIAGSCGKLRQFAGKLWLERHVGDGGVLWWDSGLGAGDVSGIGVFGVWVVGFRGMWVFG